MSAPVVETIATKAVKFIHEKTALLKAPEAFRLWAAEFVKYSKCEKSAKTICKHVRDELEKIEDISDMDFLEKVQILFVLSQSVSKPLEELMGAENCEYTLDDRRRILSFRSADGTFKRSTKTHEGVFKLFKGKPIEISQRGKEREKPKKRQRESDVEDMTRDQKIEEEEDEEQLEFTRSAKRRPDGDLTKNEEMDYKQHFERQLDVEDFVMPNQLAATPKTETPAAPVDFQIGQYPPNFPIQGTAPILPPVANPAPMTAPESEFINVPKFAGQMETLAETFGFSDLEEKAQSIWKNVNNREKKIAVDTVYIQLLGIISASDLEKVLDYPGESIKIMSLFKRLRSILMRHFSVELPQKIMEMMDTKIEEMENQNEHGVLHKNRVRIFLESLLELADKI